MKGSTLALASVAGLALGLGAPCEAQTAGTTGPIGRAVADRIRQIEARDVASWRKIAWKDSLVAARAASQREGRPVFLLVYDGNVDTGRC
jgi:hypothetical protein